MVGWDADCQQQQAVWNIWWSYRGYSPPLAQTPDDNYRQNCGFQSWRAGQESSSIRMLSWGTYSIRILSLLKSNLESKKTLDHTQYNYYLPRLWSPSCLCRYITENHTLQAFPRNHLFREYNVPLEQEHGAWWLNPVAHRQRKHHSFPFDWANHRGSVMEVQIQS